MQSQTQTVSVQEQQHGPGAGVDGFASITVGVAPPKRKRKVGKVESSAVESSSSAASQSAAEAAAPMGDESTDRKRPKVALPGVSTGSRSTSEASSSSAAAAASGSDSGSDVVQRAPSARRRQRQDQSGQNETTALLELMQRRRERGLGRVTTQFEEKEQTLAEAQAKASLRIPIPVVSPGGLDEQQEESQADALTHLEDMLQRRLENAVDHPYSEAIMLDLAFQTWPDNVSLQQMADLALRLKDDKQFVMGARRNAMATSLPSSPTPEATPSSLPPQNVTLQSVRATLKVIHDQLDQADDSLRDQMQDAYTNRLRVFLHTNEANLVPEVVEELAAHYAHIPVYVRAAKEIDTDESPRIRAFLNAVIAADEDENVEASNLVQEWAVIDDPLLPQGKVWSYTLEESSSASSSRAESEPSDAQSQYEMQLAEDADMEAALDEENQSEGEGENPFVESSAAGPGSRGEEFSEEEDNAEEELEQGDTSEEQALRESSARQQARLQAEVAGATGIAAGMAEQVEEQAEDLAVRDVQDVSEEDSALIDAEAAEVIRQELFGNAGEEEQKEPGASAAASAGTTFAEREVLDNVDRVIEDVLADRALDRVDRVVEIATTRLLQGGSSEGSAVDEATRQRIRALVQTQLQTELDLREDIVHLKETGFFYREDILWPALHQWLMLPSRGATTRGLIDTSNLQDVRSLMEYLSGTTTTAQKRLEQEEDEPAESDSALQAKVQLIFDLLADHKKDKNRHVIRARTPQIVFVTDTAQALASWRQTFPWRDSFPSAAPSTTNTLKQNILRASYKKRLLTLLDQVFATNKLSGEDASPLTWAQVKAQWWQLAQDDEESDASAAGEQATQVAEASSAAAAAPSSASATVPSAGSSLRAAQQELFADVSKTFEFGSTGVFWPEGMVDGTTIFPDNKMVGTIPLGELYAVAKAVDFKAKEFKDLVEPVFAKEYTTKRQQTGAWKRVVTEARATNNA
jgi:hypothetical protein